MQKRTTKRLKTAELNAFPTVDRHWKRACLTNLPSILRRDEAFAAALAIHEGEELARFALEARILTKESESDIADRMSIPKEVVAEYEFWFFDVRDRFDMTGWIVREAVGRCPTGVLERGDVGPLWRWMGHICGSMALEPLLAAVDVGTLRIRGIDAYLDKGVQLDSALKLLIRIQRMPAPTTSKQLNQLLRCKRALSMCVIPQTEDLLSPLRMEFLPFGEPESAISSKGSQDIGPFDQLSELLREFLIKQVPVIQAQAA